MTQKYRPNDNFPDTPKNFDLTSLVLRHQKTQPRGAMSRWALSQFARSGAKADRRPQRHLEPT